MVMNGAQRSHIGVWMLSGRSGTFTSQEIQPHTLASVHVTQIPATVMSCVRVCMGPLCTLSPPISRVYFVYKLRILIWYLLI